jgi:hypothetical protein
MRRFKNFIDKIKLFAGREGGDCTALACQFSFLFHAERERVYELVGKAFRTADRTPLNERVRFFL